MSSPHLIRPFNAAQLGLVAGDETVTVFTVLGNRHVGPSVLVHVPTVTSRLDWLDDVVETIVFIDEPIPDGATVGRIDDMLTVFSEIECDALADRVPATEALKVVRDGTVVERVDRSSVMAATCPEIVDRAVLARALTSDVIWANPTAAIAQVGGVVRFYEPSMRPSWLPDTAERR